MKNIVSHGGLIFRQKKKLVTAAFIPCVKKIGPVIVGLDKIL